MGIRNLSSTFCHSMPCQAFRMQKMFRVVGMWFTWLEIIVIEGREIFFFGKTNGQIHQISTQLCKYSFGLFRKFHTFYEKKKQKIERVNHSWKVKAQSKIWCYKWDGKKSAQTKESETQIIIQKNVFSSFQRCVDSILTGNVIERHRMHGQIEFNTTAQQKV